MSEETRKISKSMLIIKSEANSLKGVEQFLRNREWSLTSTHQLKDAILFLTRNKPSFVLVTVDHSNPKIRKLPKIILSAFPCCVMVFAEKSTTSSFKHLMDSSLEYKINPPITGPAIERAVNKFIRDQEQAARQKEQVQNGDPSKNQFEFQVEVKSGQEKEAGYVAIKGQDGVSGEPGNTTDRNADMDHLAQNLLAQLNSDDWNSSKEPQGAAGFITGAAQKSPNGAVLNFQKQTTTATAEIEGPSDKQIALETTTKKKTRAAASSEPQKPNPESPPELYVPKQMPKEKSNPRAGEGEPKKTDPIIGQEIEDLTRRGRKSQESLHIRPDGVFDRESVFVKGVNQSLDETVIKGNGLIREDLEANSHLACIIVESSRFSGYLVAALGKDKRIDNEFVELIRQRLMKFLVDKGEPIENESNLQLKVRRVDFEGWSLEYAQFLRKSVHKGDEVAMAFFPFADAQTTIGESASENMVSVETQDIQTEEPLEFNLYIYLPSNKKYILYTPVGGKFLSEQKTRLTRQGMSRMHIQKADVQNLSKFKAQNHLNSLIKDYEGKEMKVSPPAKKKKAS